MTDQGSKSADQEQDQQTSLPSQEQVLGVVWSLLRKAVDGEQVDHPACAKYAELLLKNRPKAAAGIDPALLTAIEQAR